MPFFRNMLSPYEPLKGDVAVIGAGIGGYVAAIRSAQLQKKVILIEKDRVGGVCLNWGCIPTKTLLVTVDLIEKAKRFNDFGLHVDGLVIDFRKVMARKDAVVNHLASGVQFLIKKNSIDFVEGRGVLESRNRIQVLRPDGSHRIVEAENIIIATGSEDSAPPQVKVDGEKILTVREALNLKECPESLAIIGGNMIGVEMAVIFQGLGSKVKIFESAANILPTLDREVGVTYQRILKKKGIEIVTDAEVISTSAKPNDKVELSVISRGSTIKVETEKAVITGRMKSSTRDLGLERVGVQMKDGFIIVDEHMRTNLPNIYAIGDVTGGKMLAHVAMTEGIIAAENIAGLGSTFNPKTAPTCVYCQPEIASVGLMEEEAKRQGYDVAIGKFPLLANGRALSLNETDGFAKVICEKETGEILGIHLIAPHATELICEAVLAIGLECTAEEIGSLIHAHPTISEALMEAAKAVTKKAIHI